MTDTAHWFQGFEALDFDLAGTRLHARIGGRADRLLRASWRQRGFGFALAFVPLHLLYYLYSTTTFGLAALAWRAQKH